MKGQTIAYLRVSSAEQNLDRQESLKEGADKVFEEKASAGTRIRPQLTAMLNHVREGDRIRVWSIDRLARNLIDLATIVDELNDKGVTVEFVKEGMVFDGNGDPMQRLLFQVLGSFAEFERSMIRARQAEGIAAAKAAGKYKGRKRILNDEQVNGAKERITGGVPKAQVARDLGISRQTLYRELQDA